MGGLPGQVVGEAVVGTEAVAVALDVGLVHHVSTVLVAQRVPSGSFG